MSFQALQGLGVLVAMIGMGLQLVYLPASIADLRSRRRRTRAAVLAAVTDLERNVAIHEGRTVVFYVTARIVSSMSLMTVHLLVVGSIAVVLGATQATNPSASAYEVAWMRVAVSAVVIISTASQLAARQWAMRR